MSAHEKYMNELPNDVEALEQEIERLNDSNDALIEIGHRQAGEIERLTADRDEWERLWKKASIGVFALQARVEKLEGVREHAGHLLAGGGDEAVHLLKQALAATEQGESEARWRANGAFIDKPDPALADTEQGESNE